MRFVIDKQVLVVGDTAAWEAVARVLPLERLRWISFSHFEADECGALNQILAAAPYAVPLCGRLLAMLSVNDIADREALTLGDGEILLPGRWCGATFSLMVASTIPRFSKATFSGRAMPFAASWISTHTPGKRERCWPDLQCGHSSGIPARRRPAK
jgi:hypothetical protein